MHTDDYREMWQRENPLRRLRDFPAGHQFTDDRQPTVHTHTQDHAGRAKAVHALRLEKWLAKTLNCSRDELADYAPETAEVTE